MFKFIGRRLVQMACSSSSSSRHLLPSPGAAGRRQRHSSSAIPSIPPEVRAQLAERLGLDKPLWEQYITYIANFFRGELGVSFTRYPQHVSDLLWTALPRTLVLFLTATLLAYLLGFKRGKIVAWRRGRGTETAITVGGVFLQTVFYPWFAIIMLWLFGFYPRLVPDRPLHHHRLLAGARRTTPTHVFSR